MLAGPALVALLALAGCGDTAKTDGKTKTGTPEAGHPAHGLNDGHVFELAAKDGKHLHVEFFEDKDHKLVAVLLGDDEKTEVQSSAEDATIEMTTGEKQTFKLKAEAKDGKASRYSSADKEALAALKAKGAKIKFHVEMDGKTYTAEADHILH
jgi:hypothetical protein